MRYLTAMFRRWAMHFAKMRYARRGDRDWAVHGRVGGLALLLEDGREHRADHGVGHAAVAEAFCEQFAEERGDSVFVAYV